MSGTIEVMPNVRCPWCDALANVIAKACGCGKKVKPGEFAICVECAAPLRLAQGVANSFALERVDLDRLGARFPMAAKKIRQVMAEGRASRA